MIAKIISSSATVGQAIPLGSTISMKMPRAIGRVFIITIRSKVLHKSMGTGMT